MEFYGSCVLSRCKTQSSSGSCGGNEIPVAGGNGDGGLLEVLAGLGMQPLDAVAAQG